MNTRKTTTYYKKISIIDRIQYMISAIIAITFALGLVPGIYAEVFIFTIGAIVIQIVISLTRLRILNVLLELFLLLFSIIAIVPFLGWLFRLIGMLGSILDMATFKNYSIYKKVEVNTFKSKKRPSKKKKINNKFKDAQFEEK